MDGNFFLIGFVTIFISLFKFSNIEFSGCWNRLPSNPVGLATKCVDWQGLFFVLCNYQPSYFTEPLQFFTQNSPWPELEADSSLGSRLLQGVVTLTVFKINLNCCEYFIGDYFHYFSLPFVCKLESPDIRIWTYGQGCCGTSHCADTIEIQSAQQQTPLSPDVRGG